MKRKYTRRTELRYGMGDGGGEKKMVRTNSMTSFLRRTREAAREGREEDNFGVKRGRMSGGRGREMGLDILGCGLGAGVRKEKMPAKAPKGKGKEVEVPQHAMLSS